jgi:hypothetical protein
LNTTDQLSDLTFRSFRDEDLPGVLRLWTDETDWGPLSEEKWRQWYRDTPHGACHIGVATDPDGHVVAQGAATPCTLVVDNREVLGWRISAPIVQRSFRKRAIRRIDHPAVGLLELAFRLATDSDVAVLYALPEVGWLPFFNWVPFAKFLQVRLPCVAHPVDAIGEHLLPELDGVVVERVSDFGGEFDTLWSQARRALPIHCGVVRSAHWLRWRNGDNTVFAVRNRGGDSLTGFAALRKDGLLFDILAREREDLPKVFLAVLRFLGRTQAESAGQGIQRVKVMQTPLLEPALRALGFEREDFDFAFVCASLDASLDLQRLAPERWHLMPGD